MWQAYVRNADFFSIDFVVAVMYLFPNFILISFLLAFSFFSFWFLLFHMSHLERKLLQKEHQLVQSILAPNDRTLGQSWVKKKQTKINVLKQTISLHT